MTVKNKAPAFQFYVRDWLSDPQLRMCSHSTKGIWIDLLCLMWEAPERGKLEGTVEQFCKMLSINNGDFEQFLADASVTNFANVTKCNNRVTVENRRMRREEKIRYNTRLRVRKHRSNANVTPHVTPPSSSSSSNTPISPKSVTTENLFESFWLNYPRKVGKQAAFKAWKRIKDKKDVYEKIKENLPRQKESEQWLKDNGQFVPNPATYLNQGRWEDEIP